MVDQFVFGDTPFEPNTLDNAYIDMISFKGGNFLNI
jgi:hypothetical protein